MKLNIDKINGSTYPKLLELKGGHKVLVRPLTEADEDAPLVFYRGLPPGADPLRPERGRGPVGSRGPAPAGDRGGRRGPGPRQADLPGAGRSAPPARPAPGPRL